MTRPHQSRWSARARRLPGTLLLAVVFAAILATVGWTLGGLTFLAAAPLPPVPYLHLSPLAPWPTVLTLLLTPLAWIALLRRGRRAAGLVVLTTIVLIPAAYPWSIVDWSLLLKDFGLAHGGIPGPRLVALASFPLLFIVLLHGTTTARRAPRHYRAKGVPREEARRAGPAAARTAAVATTGGLAATLLVAVGMVTAPRTLLGAVDLGPLGAPLAAALVFLAVVLLLLRDAEQEGTATPADGAGEEGEQAPVEDAR